MGRVRLFVHVISHSVLSRSSVSQARLEAAAAAKRWQRCNSLQQLRNMDMLRAMVSPNRKKLKTGEGVALPESDEEEMYENSAIKEDDDESDIGLEVDMDSDDDQPAWARKQEQRMLEHLTNVVTSNMNEVKKDINQIKLQVNLAMATADEAMTKVQELSSKVTALDEKHVSLEVVNQKIEEAISKIKSELAKPSACQNFALDPDSEKYARTMVVGGFSQDSEREVVQSLIEKHIISKADATVEEIYAYAFGSIGFVRFKAAEQMQDFLRKFGANPKPQVDGKTLWATGSKNPGDKRKARHLGKYKRVLIEVGLTNAADIKADYRRSVLMIKRRRVGQWTGEGEDGHLELNNDELKKVGIDVGVDVLQKAVKELLSE